MLESIAKNLGWVFSFGLACASMNANAQAPQGSDPCHAADFVCADDPQAAAPNLRVCLFTQSHSAYVAERINGRDQTYTYSDVWPNPQGPQEPKAAPIVYASDDFALRIDVGGGVSRNIPSWLVIPQLGLEEAPVQCTPANP